MPEVDPKRLERLQNIYGFKVNRSAYPLEEPMPLEQLLLKLEQRYAKKLISRDPFGRSTASPKQIKEALEKSQN